MGKWGGFRRAGCDCLAEEGGKGRGSAGEVFLCEDDLVRLVAQYPGFGQ